MAAFNFPNSPSTNDLHTENGVTFKWNGTIWLRVGNSYSDISTLNVSGISTFGGNIDANGDIDVDGHTNLDNVSVAGVTTFQGTIVSLGVIDLADKISHASDPNTAIRFPANDTVSAETNGSERLRITSAGSVGINSTSPDRRFTLHQDATCRMNLKSLANSTAGIEFGDEADHNAGYIVYDNTDNSFQVGVNGTGEKLRIDSSGNILAGRNSDYWSSRAAFQEDKQGRTAILVKNDTNHADASSSIILNAYGNSWTINCGSTARDSNAFTINQDATSNSNQGTERFRIDTSGRVLIGTTTEGAVQAGNVTVSGTGDVGITFRSTNSGTNRIFFADATSGAGEYAGYINYIHSDNTMLFGTNENTRLRILSNGNVLMNGSSFDTGNFGSVQGLNVYGTQPLVLVNETGGGTSFFMGKTASACYFGTSDAQPINFRVSDADKMTFDASGRLLIGSTTKAGDSVLQVYTSDRKHPAIRAHSPNANGFTILSDAYTADESNLNLGLSYSSASVVLGFGCKPSDSADNAFLSSQDTYSTRPCALKMGTEGDLRFYTTETNSTRTTDSAVSLTEVFSIDRVGNIRQKISSRYMYFGANQELQVGVNGSDPYVNAAAGDLMIRDAGNAITNIRSDGLQMYQDIYFATAGKGIVLGNTSNVDANTLDDYEEGDLSWQLRKSGATGQGSNNGSVVKYTKVGRMVHISGKIRTDSTGSNSGDNFYLDGTLPFAASANGTAVIGHFRSQDDNSGTLTASLAWMAGSSTVYIYTCVTRSDYTANENNVGCNNQTNLVITFSFAYNAS